MQTLNYTASWRGCGDAHNKKIKRNNFFEGVIGYQTVVHLIKCVQEKIFATEESGVNDFIYLLQKFSRTVSLLIPQKNYIVNPECVISNFNAPNKLMCKLESDSSELFGKAVWLSLLQKQKSCILFYFFIWYAAHLLLPLRSRASWTVLCISAAEKNILLRQLYNKR